VKWKLEIEMKLLKKIELELKYIFFRMEITLPVHISFSKSINQSINQSIN